MAFILLRRSRCVCMQTYPIAVCVSFHGDGFFYMSRKSLCIRRGRGLLANENPASTSPGRRVVGVFILGICAITTA